MTLHQVRLSDSRFVERITQVTFTEHSREWTTPDGCWDIVVLGKQGKTIVLHTGLISRPVLLVNEPGDSYMAISFKPGVFVPQRPGSQMLDRGLLRPLASAHQFCFEAETLEIPGFENAEGLVDRLVRRGRLAYDELVAGVAEGRQPAATVRTLQRHFQTVLGMTPKQFAQIKRACGAVELLRGGMAPSAVAAAAGYADQPHLTRALKHLVQRTPAEIAREARAMLPKS